MAFSIQKEIERLLQYGLKHRLLDPLDVLAARNALLDLFGIPEPWPGNSGEETGPEQDIPDSAEPILEPMLDYAAEQGLLPDNTTTYRDLFDTKIMGLLMPRPSEVARRFWETAERHSIERATDEFYRLSQVSHYIRMHRIRRNLYWKAQTEFGELEITVNLAKPEKDPKEIAAARLAPASRYPACLLCAENVGFAGHANHPARQNHRIIPLTLEGERWYFQYSPYVYYNEHCIVFSERHRPMKIDEHTFARLLEFVARFPHYFIGSNADLPIVGGSILSHDHFQGGRHRFPMDDAPPLCRYRHPRFPGIQACVIRWPLSVIRLGGEDREPLQKLASELFAVWQRYNDEAAGILAFSEEGGRRVPHNTVTPIARINRQGLYELDLVLRNNRTSPEHPEGMFHPHRELHHIKKENIGLIEVMGLAILPGRLKTELERIARVLSGSLSRDEAATGGTAADLQKHRAWIEELVDRYGTGNHPDEAGKIVQAEVGQRFARVLAAAGVFKQNERGRAHFHKFMEAAGFVRISES